jgi:curved DNA-binding protein CbpA
VTEAPDPYKVLQVDPEAEDEVIQAAYRRLAQKYHPDLSIGQAAIDRMVAINAAWETIGDPARRAVYDLSRRAARAKAAETASASDAGRTASGRSAHAGDAAPTGGGGAAGSGDAGASGRGSSAPAGAAPASSHPADPRPGAQRSPDTVSRDWTPGRSTTGSGYDAKTMRSPEGHGAAGPPPGNASGSVLTFGRYAGWSLGEVGRRDLEYLEWLDRMPIGRPYRDEIDRTLRSSGRRRSADDDPTQRRGLFRRR